MRRGEPAGRAERAGLRAAGALVTLLSMLVVACSPSPGAESKQPGVAQEGRPAPTFTLPLASGGSAHLADERGSVTVVNFWATWCVPCREEMPELQHLADTFGAQGVQVWGVNLQEDAATVQAFADEVRVRFPLLLDQDGSVVRAYGVRGLPATFVVDQSGTVRHRRFGQLPPGGPETAWTVGWLEDRLRELL